MAGRSLADIWAEVKLDLAKDEENKLRKKIGNIDTSREGKKIATRFGAGFGGTFGSIVSRSAGVFAAGFAGIKVGGFLKDAVGQASTLGETMSKSAAVFGAANPIVQKFAATAATSLGQSKQEAIGAAAQFGNMFNQLGIGQKTAATMSTQMVGLASDFASFHNADITEVLQAQEAAFRGEFDSIQKFVPTLNAAAVEQEGMRLKLASSTKELDAQDKALATQSLMMRGAGKAAGDFSRTSGGLANQQRILSAQFTNLKTSIGTAALPAVTSFFTFVNSTALPWVRNFVRSEGFTNFLARVRTVAGDAFGFFRAEVLPRLQEFAGYVRDTVIPIVGQLVTDRLAALRSVFNDVRKAVSDNKPQLQQLGEGLQKVGKFVIEQLIPHMAKLSNDTLVAVGKSIRGTITVIGWMVTAVREIVQAVSDGAGWINRKWAEIKTGGASLLRWFQNLPGEISKKLGDTARTLRTKGLQLVQGLWTAAQEKWRSVGTWISGLPASARRWLGDVSATLKQKGRDVLQGFWNGLTEKWSDVTKWVGGIATWIREHKGPISLDRQLLAPAGRALMEGFLTGLKSGAGPAWSFVQSVGGRSVDALRSMVGPDQVTLPQNLGVLSGPNRRVMYQGKALDLSTFRKIKAAEQIIGSGFRITQGSYRPRTSYSGSTHMGGGVFDSNAAGMGWASAVAALRKVGFAAWHRTPSQGPWGHHIHAVEAGNTRAHPTAQRQVLDYLRGGDGLAGYRRGTPWVPNDQFAYLHKGEAVLPAEVNRQRMAGNGTVRLDDDSIGRLARAINADRKKDYRDAIRESSFRLVSAGNGAYLLQMTNG
jgi:hypothetical protein